MIFDRLENASLYHSISPLIAKSLDYLANTDVLALEPGRYDIQGDDAFALVQGYRTKAPAVAVWESHRKYMDIQYIASGNERMGFATLHDAPAVKTPYDADSDVILYQPGQSMLEMKAGDFAMFWPQDIHGPGLTTGNPETPSEVTKVVIKIAL